MYYLMIEDNKIIGASECTSGGDIIDVEVSEEIYNNYTNDHDLYVWNGTEIVENPDYEEIKRQKERERKDSMTLTSSDVERALLKAKGMDFEDMKIYLKEEQGYTDSQIKAIGVELRANDFFRGATMGEEPNKIRIVDTIGALFGYTSDDMDYLFEHKELPSGETP